MSDGREERKEQEERRQWEEERKKRDDDRERDWERDGDRELSRAECGGEDGIWAACIGPLTCAIKYGYKQIKHIGTDHLYGHAT